ncbi:MAG: MlaD family protein [Candidatus Omnitrophota bacterium]|nr:MlaD family protein [Candidatus Omnitrophota bacterium]
MASSQSKLELKVGVFVFAGLVILSIFILSIERYKKWNLTYRVHLTFNFVNGVKLGAPVRFAGVDVGDVKEINLKFIPQENRTKVDLICRIRWDIKIPSDSVVWINTLGLLGEKYVEIMPGKDYVKIVHENQELAGQDPILMNETMVLAKNIVSNLDESIVKLKNGEGTIGKLLFNDMIYNDLQALILDIRKNPWKLFFRTKEKK